MIVRVYNFLSEEKPKFSQNLVGIVSDVTNFKYTRRAYDIGSFEMTIPTHADETECIQPDRMLIVGEKIKQTYIDGDPTKRIVVGTFLYVTDVEKKDDTITVTGYDLKYLFALRVTLFPKEEQDKGTYGYYVTSGTTFSCISDIIDYNIVNATDSDRQIYGMFSITMPVNQTSADPPLTGIQDDRYMTRLEPVSTAIFNLLKNCKTHFYDMRLIIDDNAEDGDNYNPHMESSEDKPVIIIDESRYNIKSYTRKDGTSAYKNAIYAVVGSGDDVTVKCVKRPDDTASGVKRKEVVLDVDTDSVAEIDRYALKAAEEYVISDDFEIEPLFMDDEAEPELAQKVSIRIDGVEYETVITEITDEYANGKHTQSYVCGDKKLKVLNVLNKATAGNTQKIVNNKIAAGNAGGVGKFTNTARNCEIFNDYENNVASAYYSHAEGYMTTANAPYSHAEGYGTVAREMSTHAEGRETTASGNCSHAENTGCIASGPNSHAEGYYTMATGGHSHASGNHTVAGAEVFALGSYNKTTDGVWLVVGNGWGNESNEWRSDALVLDRSGNLHISGKFTADGGVGYVLPTATAYTLGGVMIGENINVSDTGVISVNLSEYLKSGEISDWAKAESKPAYTADEVGAATAADITAAVNAVEIGGRNLLYYSRFDKKYPAGWAYSAAVTYTFDDGVTTLTKAETASRHFTTQASVSNGVVAANPNLLPENGCTYTISCEVMKAEGYDVGNGTKITNRYNFTDGTVKDFDVDVSGASETAWTKYSRTYTYASDKDVRYTQFIVALGAQACGIKIRNVKFEKGNKPTDWSPAPEDDERRIASLEARVAALEAAAVSGGEV